MDKPLVPNFQRVFKTKSNMASLPECVLVFSGKRKSGKDYVTALLLDRIGRERCSILRLSAPLKSQYAKEHNLDFARLLDASDYKEKYRADMIIWGEERRNQDPGYFCRLITTGPGSELPVWVISDARRKSDVEFFCTTYPEQVLTVRVEADEAVRTARGWKFTHGVDDVESECGLDDGVSWDFVITNNGDSLEDQLENILRTVQSKLTS